MWGTMYVPYRKAYISGMNPLSFVTAFTVGELGTVLALTLALDGGLHSPAFSLIHQPGLVFWLFLGGFVWVIGDLFQQFAAKYLGIGRGIPLSNTNQLWGLAWGALVFGELAGADSQHKLLVIAGSVIMILGALAIGTAVASAREAHLQQRGGPARVRPLRPRLQPHPRRAGRRRVRRPQRAPPLVGLRHRRYRHRRLRLAGHLQAIVPPLAMDMRWVAALAVVLLVSLAVGGWSLWRRTQVLLTRLIGTDLLFRLRGMAVG